MTGAALRIIADDYGIAPATDVAIRTLLTAAKIDGTGCMTLFPEWPRAAQALRSQALPPDAEIGLHLTLTDFAPLAGESPVGGTGRLPSVGRLILASLSSRLDERALARELNAQLQAFVAAFGRHPDFIDGHQHVHFLPPVRRWLVARREAMGSTLPWLRGEPATGMSPDWRSAAKIRIVAAMARGFDAAMRRAGFTVRGPLTGFYDWQRAGDFAGLLGRSAAASDGVFMCHPGQVDDVLAGRDKLTTQRQTEFELLLRR